MSAKPFRLAVKAMVEDRSGRILVIRRSAKSKYFGGTWDVPGGKVDRGEDFAAALVREVREETGLAVSLQGVAGVTEYTMPAVRLAVLFLRARARAGRVRLSDEHDAYEWVPRHELAEKEFSPQLREFVKEYVQSTSET
jgi:8-oxo-dGTP diphosphatase